MRFRVPQGVVQGPPRILFLSGGEVFLQSFTDPTYIDGDDEEKNDDEQQESFNRHIAGSISAGSGA